MSNVVSLRPRVTRNVLPSAAELEHTLGMPAMIEERIPFRLAKSVGLAVSIAIILAVVWAGIARINEISVASGAMVPIGFERVIQHYEGGIVRAVMVREGDVVQAGAPIVEIGDAVTKEDRTAIDRQMVLVKAQLESQRALAEDRVPDFGFIPQSYFSDLKDNRNAHEAAVATIASQKREFDSQIVQARLAYDALMTQLDTARQEVLSAEVEMKRYDELFKKGVATEVQATERQRMLRRAQADVSTLTSRSSSAAERLKEVELQKASYLNNLVATTRQRILELENGLSTLESNLRKKDERYERAMVTSPVKGIVKTIKVRGGGEVIQGGQPIATIVPLNDPLVAETRVAASQVGYLKVGQPAHVKLAAYDFTRYGWLPAHIASISPSAFQQEGSGASFYVIKLSLDRDHLANAVDAPILPGMEVTADIITGQKTVLQYILTPLQRTFSSAFGER